MNRNEALEKFYNTIMELDFANEFKTMISRIHVFLKNKRKNKNSILTLPNYLWAAKSGCGVSTLLLVFSEYLYTARAIEFCGTVKSFEFKLDYVSPDLHFAELTRLDNTISGFAGYNRYFKGVVCIDITDWFEHTNEDHFKTLLEYASDNSNKILFIFCIHTDDSKTIKTLDSVISSKIRLETLVPRFPDAAKLVEFIETRFINVEGFSFTGDAKALLCDSVKEIVGGAHFNGFKTITHLADKILFDILATEQSDLKIITAEMLSDFRKDSSYVKNVKVQHGMITVIGFVGKDEHL